MIPDASRRALFQRLADLDMRKTLAELEEETGEPIPPFLGGERGLLSAYEIEPMLERTAADRRWRAALRAMPILGKPDLGTSEAESAAAPTAPGNPLARSKSKTSAAGTEATSPTADPDAKRPSAPAGESGGDAAKATHDPAKTLEPISTAGDAPQPILAGPGYAPPADPARRAQYDTGYAFVQQLIPSLVQMGLLPAAPALAQDDPAGAIRDVPHAPTTDLGQIAELPDASHSASPLSTMPSPARAQDGGAQDANSAESDDAPAIPRSIDAAEQTADTDHPQLAMGRITREFLKQVLAREAKEAAKRALDAIKRARQRRERGGQPPSRILELSTEIASVALQRFEREPERHKQEFEISDFGNNVEPGEAIESFVEAHQAGKLLPDGQRVAQLNLPRVSEEAAERVKAETGLDISGMRHSIDTPQIDHVFRRHGVPDLTDPVRPKGETDPNQEPVSAEALGVYLDIAEHFDRITGPRRKGAGSTITYE